MNCGVVDYGVRKQCLKPQVLPRRSTAPRLVQRLLVRRHLPHLGAGRDFALH
jgi:hypothetical protein